MTRSAKRHPATVGRSVIGTVLVVLGVAIFIEQVSGLDLRFMPFLIGAGLLAGWAQTRCRPLLIAGSIVAAAGIGVLLRPAVGPVFGDVVMNLSLAAGFLAIHLLSDPRPTWPLVISGVLITVAALDLGDVGQMLPAAVVRVGLPLVVIAAGLILIFRDRLTRKVSALLLGALAVIGVILSQQGDASGVTHGPPKTSPGVVQPL